MFAAVLKPRSAAELARLIDVELLPECDPRLFDSVPDTSVYYRIKESLKAAYANAAQASQQLQEDSEKAVGRRKEWSTVSDESVRQSRGGTTKARHREKKLVRPLPQKTPSLKSDASFLKQSSSVGRRRRTKVKDADASLHVNAAVPRNEPRTGSSNKEHRSKISVTKAHASWKRKRKDLQELVGHEDSFPSMDCLMYDEMPFSWHLPQLSFFAELDHNPDDPLLLISLCELDDIAAFQRQDFIHDLNSTYIGRKPRFSAVRSLYCDRTSRRIGQLSLQTYCDGHFIDCGLVSRVHMACLHQWATKEPLEVIVCNVLKEEHKPAVSLPYPSVRCLSDVVCYWLSSELFYLMSNVSVSCAHPPDIFIGSSLQSDLTINCLYQMFCRYVEFLCEKAEKYFIDVECGRIAAHAGQQTGRRVEPGTYAAHRARRAKLLKHTLPSLRRRAAPSKRTTKQLSTWQENIDYDYEDMPSESEQFVLVDDADFEQVMPFGEKDSYNSDQPEKDAVRHRKADVAAAHRKHRLPEDYYDDRDQYNDRERWTSDMQSKVRRIHRDHTELLAAEKENDVDVNRKKHSREMKDATDAKSTKPDMLSPSKHKDMSDFVHCNEHGNIAVQFSDTGRTVIEAKSQQVAREDELKSVADEMPASLSVADKLSEVNHSPLYSIVLDHCYSSASLCSLAVQSVASTVDDPGKDEDVKSIDVDGSDNINPPSVSVSTHMMPLELVDAGENVHAEVPITLLDGKKSGSPLQQTSSGELQEKTGKAVGLVKDLSSSSDDTVSHSQADMREKICIKPLSQKTQSIQLDSSSLKQTGKTQSVQIDSSSMKQTDTTRSVQLDSSSSKQTGKAQSVQMDSSSSKQTGKSTASKLHPLSSLSVVKMASIPGPEVNAKGFTELLKQPVTKKPIHHKECAPPQKVAKEVVAGVQKNYDFGKKAHRKSDDAEISHKEVSAVRENIRMSNKDINSNNSKPLSAAPKAPPKTSDKNINSNKSKPLSASPNTPPKAPPKPRDISSDDSKIPVKKMRIEVENAVKVSNKVEEVSSKITEPEKLSADTGDTSEARSVPADNDGKAADADISVESEKTAAKALPSAAELAATARAASHYQDAYLSEMADAYDTWPLSNFDPAFDPTSIPEGHAYNPFRKTWPILQHVIDGKADLLLKVCSFPDVSLFSIRRVMRENGFLWAVCLSLFEPSLNKSDSTDSFPDLIAVNKNKGTKSSNPLMQAFRQAVEAKKKVADAAKSKSALTRQNSDDTGGTQHWSTKRPAKMSIVFGSAVKSGGSLSSVVRTDQSAKTAPSANKFTNLLTTVISNMNSKMSDMISWKCGEQCMDKDAHNTEHQSNSQATSKHLSTLSDLAVDMYDRAEYKLEKIFSAQDAEKQKSADDNKAGAVLQTSSVVITTVAADTCQAHLSVSSTVGNVIRSSSPSLSHDDTMKTSTVHTTLVNGSVSASAPVSQPFVPQPTAATSAAAEGVTTTADGMCMPSAAIAVTSGSAATSDAVPVTVKVVGTTVADMLPPPLPPLPFIGAGFDSHRSAVASSTSEALTSFPSSMSSANKPVDQVSINPVTCTTAYQATVGSFALPAAVSSHSVPSAPLTFSSTSLPLDHLLRVPPPPSIHPNLYSMPPPVGIPLNVPPPGFVSTSVPPPPLPCPPPPMPWYSSSSSAAGGFPAAAGTNASVQVSGGFQKMSQVPNTAVSCVGVAANSQTPSGKPVPGSSTLQTSGLVVASSSVVCSAFMTSTAGPKSVVSSLIQGGRLRGPLKIVNPVIQSTPPGLAGPTLRQVRPFPSMSSPEITQVSPLQNKGLCVTVPLTRSHAQVAGFLGTGPAVQAVGFPVMSQSNRVPVQPVAAIQNVLPNTSGPLAGQTPCAVVQPRLPRGRLAQPTVLGSQPPGAIRPVPPLPSQQKNQPRATGPDVGQSPRGIVRPGLPMNESIQPRSALPVSQPRGPMTPVSARAAGPPMGQSPRSTVRPQRTGPAVSVPLSSASGTPQGPAVHAESKLPSSPAQASDAATGQPSRPLAAAGGTGIVQRGGGPLLTPSSRVYVLNSDSSPLCKDVEVSL